MLSGYRIFPLRADHLTSSTIDLMVSFSKKVIFNRVEMEDDGDPSDRDKKLRCFHSRQVEAKRNLMWFSEHRLVGSVISGFSVFIAKSISGCPLGVSRFFSQLLFKVLRCEISNLVQRNLSVSKKINFPFFSLTLIQNELRMQIYRKIWNFPLMFWIFI